MQGQIPFFRCARMTRFKSIGDLKLFPTGITSRVNHLPNAQRDKSGFVAGRTAIDSKPSTV